MVQPHPVTAVQVLSGIRRKQLVQWNQLLILAVEPPAGRAPLPLPGPLDQSGSDRIEFHVEDGVLDGLFIEQFGTLETIAPEMTSPLMRIVEPPGIVSVQVGHQSRQVEQTPIEGLPSGIVPFVSDLFRPVSIELPGMVLQLLTGQGAELLEMDDEVEVIVHDLEGGQATAVGVHVEQHHVQQFETGLAIPEGEPTAPADDSIGDVIEGGFRALVSGSSGHGCCRPGFGIGPAVEAIRAPDDNNDPEPGRTKETPSVPPEN